MSIRLSQSLTRLFLLAVSRDGNANKIAEYIIEISINLKLYI